MTNQMAGIQQGWTRERIVDALSEFERSHPVDQFVTHGVHVWPVIRNMLAPCMQGKRQLGAKSRRGAGSPWFDRIRNYSRLVCDFAQQQVRDRVSNGQPVPWRPNCDVVFLTGTDRRVTIDGRYVHYLVDPFRNELARRGLSSHVWEWGEPRWPRAEAATWITPRMVAESRWLKRMAPRRVEDQPDWFQSVAAWSLEEAGLELTWPVIVSRMKEVERGQLLFPRWLRRSQCRFLVVDNWSSVNATGAILAARSLGIKTVELQHGIKGLGHWNYCRWVKCPDGGYETVPDVFWCWGSQDVVDAQQSNAGRFSRYVAGGNLWINGWLNETVRGVREETHRAARALRSDGKVILVTLQVFNTPASIRRLMEAAPPDFTWLLRLHRSSPATQRDAYRQECQKTGRKFLIDEATDLPLYALMQNSDVHVTGCSTCALEALAFGIPTILLDRNGLEMFARFIDRGVMYYCDDEARFMHYFNECAHVGAQLCRDSARDVFASDADVDRAIQDVFL